MPFMLELDSILYKIQISKVPKQQRCQCETRRLVFSVYTLNLVIPWWSNSCDNLIDLPFAQTRDMWLGNPKKCWRLSYRI